MTATRRLSRALVAALLATGLATTGAPPAGAAEAAYLTVTLAEGCVGLRRGETQPVSFTVTNTSAAPVRGVSVVPVTLPTGVTAAVTPAGTTIPAGYEATFRALVTVASDAPLGAAPMRFEARAGDDATAYESTPSVVDRPVPPAAVAATPGDGTATVTWTPDPANAYADSAVTRYTVTASPGGSTAEVSGTETSAVVAGLANGTAYTFAVTAATVWGTSDPSAPSASVVPAAPETPATPGAPGAYTGTASLTALDRGVSVSLTDEDGAGATGYDVQLLPLGAVEHVTRGAPEGTPWADGGALFAEELPNGTSYTVRVRMTNAAGAGPWSAQSAAAVPAGVPFQPYLQAVAGDGSAYVCWAGTTGNGSPVTEYVVTDEDDGTWSFGPAARSGWVTGLDNATGYRFSVRAVNAVGAGEAFETTGPATQPGGTPPAVSGVTAVAGNGSAVVSWDLPAGTGFWGYQVVASPGGASAFVLSTVATAQVTGLANGTAHTFTVRALGRHGPSPASAPSAAVTPGAPDVTPPALTVGRMAAFTLSGTAKVLYASADAASYDVRYRVGRYDTAFGAYRYPAAWQARTATSASVATVKGWTYCFGVRARDAAGNVTAWSADRCTAAPLDDRALSASRGWTRATSGNFYAGTYTATTTRGATLTGPVVTARRLVLVVARCQGCAIVGVYLDGVQVMASYTSGSSTTYRRQLSIDLEKVRTGRITIKALTSGRLYVDGLGASRI